MNKLKNWFIVHKGIFIIALVALISGYYLYLTNISRLFQLEGTYCVRNEYSSIILEFDGNRMSTYMIEPDMNTIAVRVDYKVGYRRFNEDIIGNFWSDDGIEPFALRGSDVAGRLYAECVGTAIWTIDEDMVYYNQSDVLALEESSGESYSFGSRFYLKGDFLRIYNYADLDFQKIEDIPEVEAELMRLIDSLCPPEFE